MTTITIGNFFIELRHNNGAIWVENNSISLNVPEALQTEGIFGFIKANKSRLTDILVGNRIFSEEKFFEREILAGIEDGHYPLSRAQERLWFIEQYERGTNAYHIPAVYEIDDEASIEGIKYALTQIVARHEVLRTTISQDDHNEQGVQLVHNEPLTIGQTSVDGDSYMQKIEDDINRPFDLTAEYPIRVNFYNVMGGEQSARTFLLINMHHIASDGWSIDVFKKELFAYYEAFIAGGRRFSLPPLEIQYKDYATWQKAYLSGEILENQLNYWRDKLSGYQTLELTTDYARPAEINYRGASEIFTLDSDVSDRLRGLARRLGVTLHSVMLSSINILLSKYTGQEDIVTGSPIANRHHRQTEGLIGFFVNTLANRTLLSKTQSYEELAQQVHLEQIEAQLRQDLPFEKLVDELGVERDRSRHPVFQVMFSVQSFDNIHKGKGQQKSHVRSVQTDNMYRVERFDLSIFIDDSEAQLRGQVSYASALFSKDTILRFVGHYKNLLRQLASAPGEAYSKHSLLDAAEYKQLVYDWNAAVKNYPNDKTIHNLFEEQAERTPDNIALVYDGRELIYRELNERSNQLARRIRKVYQQKTGNNLPADALIAMHIDRSLEMVIGILAILKAGGAYVPMDTAYPQDRIDYLIADSNAEIVLSLANKSPNALRPQEKVIYIDLDNELYREEENANLPGHSNSTHLAYVIYTSGTTGKPKGVLQTHENVMRLFTCTDHQFNFNAGDVWTLFHSYVFDFTIWELWGSLLYGGKLLVISQAQTKDMVSFYRLCVAYKVTVLNQTPSSFYNFADVAAHAEEPGLALRYIIFGGEALNIKQLQPWWDYQKRQNLGTKLINMYGITETTVHVTYKELASDETVQSNIGRPLADLKAYVLDAGMNPVPVNVTGELYIGGAGLARGYLNRDELTRDRFIHNPFADIADKAKGYTRLYKTGDLVKWLPCGDLEYIGRNDEQVKIRGYRIELGEIEHALASVDGIKQSCVLVKERKGNSANSKYLVGYYVPTDNDSALTQTAILKELSRALPEYMVPAALVQMESFPITINGKLDKGALPNPDLSSSEEQYTAPATETELAISKIWREVLGLERISTTDDFFRVGGDSILSIQVSGRIRQAGLNCQVKDIFECRTIARLAAHLSQKTLVMGVQSEQGLLSGELNLLPVQQWFMQKVESRVFAGPNHYNQSFLIRVPELNTEKLEAILPALTAHHDMLRVQYNKGSNGENEKASGNAWRQFYRKAATIPGLNILDINKHTGEEIIEILTGWQSNFDLEHGNLFQFGYLHGYHDGSARIYCALHHMVVDSVSWRVLAEDIRNLYEGATLQRKGSSYRQWVTTMEKYADVHPKEAAWWQAELDGMTDIAVVNTGEPSAQIIEFDTKSTRFLLQGTSRAYHTDINDLLLTALAYSLKDIDQQDRHYITLEGHGREDIDPGMDISRTVGWFTSMYPVKLDVGSDIKNTIVAIKDSLRAMPNKGIGFGAFAVCSDASFDQNNLPLISFNYLGQFDAQEGDWQVVAENSGNSIHRLNRDENRVNINGMVTDGRLVFSVATRLGEDVTKQLSDSFKAQLTEIINHCKDKLAREGSSYTPGDFYNVAHEGDLVNLPLMRRPATLHEPFLMTDIQKAYLLGRFDNFEIGGVSNHIYHEFKFGAPINIPKFEQTINWLIDSHPELRTVFDIETLTQRYLDAAQLDTYRVKIDNYNSDYCEEHLLPARSALSHRVYDASQYPLFTFHISRFNNSDVLHVSIDLLLLDAESRQNFFTEITNLYHIDTPGLTPPKLNFKDYQDYIGFLKHSKWYAKDKNYWTNKVASLPLRPALSLKTDPKTIAKPTFGMSARVVEEPVWSKFKDNANKHGISASAALLSIFGYVLSRYSSTRDFLITLTVFSRYGVHPDVNSIWGDFTSTNLFGYKNEGISIKEKLLLTHDELWDDLSHALYNGLEVLRQLQAIHKLDPYQAVSPIVFTGRVSGSGSQSQVNNTDQYFFDKSEDKASRVWMAQTSQAWIDLQAIEMDNQFCSGWMYVEQLFDKEFIEKLNADYCGLIEHLAVANWESPMLETTLPESDKVVVEYANSHTQEPVSETLVGMCLAGIAQHEHRVAVVDTTGRYTYEQIGVFSYNIAGYLHDKKLSAPGRLIGILSEKGHKQVTAALGIMYSGSAYLPLHVEWPAGRVDEVLQEGLVETVLVSKAQYRDFIKDSAIASKYTWLIIEEAQDYQPEIEQAQLQKPKPDDIAYVIFTSGSTGKPKGVTISHSGAANTIVSVNNRFDVCPNDKALALSELSFDLSVYDMFGLLAAGGTIVFPDQEKTKEPGHWYQLIKENGITLWNTVPQLMQLLVDYVNSKNESLASLKTVIMSGDWIPVKLPNQIKALSSNATVMSLGGATEGSIWSIWYEIKEADPKWNSIPYGEAMPNQKMYVLNAFGEHCPVGVTGEIHIGGEGVALGYWVDEEKTNASFIVHQQLGRLYKTGDLGKWNRNGYIEFEGRKDSQVKLNGYRVELDEISAKLNHIKGIDKSLVAIQDNQLVAYIVPDTPAHHPAVKNEKSHVDKLNFKFEQHGIRKNLQADIQFDELELDEEQYRLRKSYRQFNDNYLSLNTTALARLNEMPVIDKSRPVSSLKSEEILKQLLKPLSALQLHDKVLPKYLYPSGGSTYAIQCYVDIREDMGELKQGSYYYEPVAHFLSGIGESPINASRDDAPLKLSFKLYKPAIEPLYGEMAVKLAWIEMGHILALLQQQLSAMCVGGRLRIIDKEAGKYHHLVEIAIDFNTEFSGEILPGQDNCLNIDYLNKDQQKFSDNEGHQYDLAELDIFSRISELSQIIESSQGLILFKGTAEAGSLLNSGYQAQTLAENLYAQDIGSCTLGFMPYEGVNYSMVVGDITNVQKAEAESHAKATTSEALIKQQLKQYLPVYMLPEYYITLNELPLTANGKVDYKQLPKAEVEQDEYIAPATDTERKLCSIWQELLTLDRVGTTDDFFRIGGNSILAIQASQRMSKALGFELKVADVFRFKSIGNIINNCREIDRQNISMVKPYHSRYNSNLPDLIMVHPGNAGSEVYQGLAEIMAAKYNCIGIDNHNIHSTTKIGSLSKLALHYLDEYESRYKVQDAVNLLGWSLGGEIALEMATILEGRGHTNINVILLDTILADYTIRVLRSKVSREESIDYLVRLKDIMLNKELEDGYFEKVISSIDAEKDLADASISARLRYANVTLFKATQPDTAIDTENYRLSYAHTKNLAANNVELVADRLEVINLECSHLNIIETNTRNIVNYLLQNSGPVNALNVL